MLSGLFCFAQDSTFTFKIVKSRDTIVAFMDSAAIIGFNKIKYKLGGDTLFLPSNLIAEHRHKVQVSVFVFYSNSTQEFLLRSSKGEVEFIQLYWMSGTGLPVPAHVYIYFIQNAEGELRVDFIKVVDGKNVVLKSRDFVVINTE